MPLRKSVGNMYKDVTHTWSPVKGLCEHSCSYCFMKRFPQKPIRLVDSEFIDLDKDNFVFVCSGCDLFANDIPEEWILKVFEHCKKYDNRYLFQSKNPIRMYLLRDYFPKNSIVGTTIETNRTFPCMGNAPKTSERAVWMFLLKKVGFKTFVTIEPILDFDLQELSNLVLMCKPDFVNVGGDSKSHKLPEPDKQKIKDLIFVLKKFTKVKLKTNLNRLMR